MAETNLNLHRPRSLHILDEYYKPLLTQELDLREIKKHVAEHLPGVGFVTGYVPDIIE